MTKRTYGIMIDEKPWADCPAVTARIMVCEEGDRPYPINPRTEGEHEIWDAPKRTHGLLLNNLVIRTHLSGPLHIAGRAMVIGPCYDFASISYVDTKVARAAVKTLERIDRAIANAKCSEAGDIIMTIAKAIGATFYVERLGKEPPSFSYERDQWRFGDITEARDVYRAAVQRLHATQRDINRTKDGEEAA